MYALFIKPFFDFIFALLLLILLLPLFLLISVVLWQTQGQVIFAQKRIGYKNKPFTCYKFCTMNNNCDQEGNLLPDKERLTKIGSFLRNYSLDELPQLLNILKGEMSFVGTRPLLPEYLPLYSAEQLRRHEVKGGITGLAQIKGRNRISWQQRFEYDLYYVENQSFSLDLQILWQTFWQIGNTQNINANAEETMERFKGN